ncbi:MAG: sugar phosphate isomerase/epimerase family protein [Terriglobales bacterium]
MIVSTHLFSNEALHTALLDRMVRAGAQGIELFCARQSFDYRDARQKEALVHWFRENPMPLHAIHSPLFSDDCWGRSGAPAINLAERDTRRRIASMDEIQRALEIAEEVPCRFLIQHLGVANQEDDERAMDAAFTSLERLRVLTKPLGITILLENIPNELSTPERLMGFLQTTHLDDLGVCLDVGHAHFMPPPTTPSSAPHVLRAFEVLRTRVRSVHLHDNHGAQSAGESDPHLWPGEGTVPWNTLMPELRAAGLPCVLELHSAPADAATWERLTRTVAELQGRA